MLDFTPVDIIFHEFLELYTTSQKRFSSRVVLFNGFTQLPPKSAKRDKIFFADAPLKVLL